MYWIADVILVLIAVFIIQRCTANGFVKGLLRFARVFIAFLIASLLGASVGSFFCNAFVKQPIYDFVYEKVDAIYQTAENQLTGEELLSEFPDFLLTPEVLKKIEQSADNAQTRVAEISESIATPFATVVSNAIAYVVVFILAFILLTVAVWLLNGLIEKIKLFGVINHVLGFVWGALLALCLCFAVSSVIRVLFGSSELYTQSVVIKFFGESALLNFLSFLDVGKTFLSSAFE